MNDMTKYLTDMFSLESKTAIVTGAGGHLCSEMSRTLALAGAHVILVDLRLKKIQELAAKLNAEGLDNISLYQCDTSKKNYVDQLYVDINKSNGFCDILLNGAGTNSSTPFFEITESNWDEVYSSQMKSTLFMTQKFAKPMVDNKNGNVINISSASAGPPLSKAFCYSTAKASILSLTQNLAREFARDNVRVNAIRPGFFPTEWNIKNFIDDERKSAILGHTPQERFGNPNELSSALLFLLSNASSFVTGTEVTVDGGFACMTI